MKKKYDRREFLKQAALGSAGLVGSASVLSLLNCSVKPNLIKQPNIILIMADDMGYSDVGCYGGEIETPNIDRLALNGLRFRQFYNTSRCCPTRASLLTGLYSHQAGVGWMMQDQGLEGYRGDLNQNCVTIAQVLKQTGYATYMSGKWHVTRFGKPEGPKNNWPLQRGFDRFFGVIGGSNSYFNPRGLTYGNKEVQYIPEDFYFSDAISDHALRFINEHRQAQANKPFFLYVSYTAPHWPLHALPEDIQKYQGRYNQGWDALRAARHKRMIDLGVVEARWKRSERDPRVPLWEKEKHKEWQASRMEVYSAMIDRMDQGIGRILSTLEQVKCLDNTLIIFLSDNGGCAEEFEFSNPWFLGGSPKQTRDGRPVKAGNLPSITPGPEDTHTSYGIPWANASNTPFRLYKSWIHEGGISTPLIAHWPGQIKTKGEFRSHPGHLIDIMATFVDVAGAEYPLKNHGSEITPMEGVSLMPAFANEPIKRDAIYFEHEANQGVRMGKWKLVSASKKYLSCCGAWELYDLENDRTETKDLAAQFPDLVKKMALMWQVWAERTNALPWPYD